MKKEGKNTQSTTKTRHVPTFQIEVTSPSDSLAQQQEKCRKWIEAGVSEAILLHPKAKTAYVFMPSAEMIEMLTAAKIESTVLSGFVIDCHPIWEDPVEF